MNIPTFWAYSRESIPLMTALAQKPKRHKAETLCLISLCDLATTVARWEALHVAELIELERKQGNDDPGTAEVKE